MSALYIAVSCGFAWGVGGGGPETGPARAIDDARRRLVWAARRLLISPEASEILARASTFEIIPATREEAKRVVNEGPLPWPPEAPSP